MRSSVERDRPAALGNRAKFVDPVAMVGMFVRYDDGIEIAHAGVQQLRTDVGPAVDQEPFTAAFNQQGAPRTAILGFIGVALAPIGADPGDARGGPATENRQLQFGLALLNSR